MKENLNVFEFLGVVRSLKKFSRGGRGRVESIHIS